ncbi:MAG: hypothetical protein O3B85_06520 [Planctomycetota bacterium]|nr:hypothetical protein [Planctomycetota bacterium]
MTVIRVAALTGILVLTSLQGCVAPVSGTVVRPESADVPGTDVKRELEADLAAAEARHHIAVMGAQIARDAAAHRVEMARVELQLALEGLQLFQRERELDLEEGRQDLERDEFSLEQAVAELRELREMYEEEEFAKTTKELVLRRGEMRVEMQKNSLRLARERHELLERSLRSDEVEKRQAVEEARRGVAEAEAEQRKTDLEQDLEVREVQREAEKLRAEVEGGR